MGEKLSLATKRELKPIKLLAQQLRQKGVTALFLGDGDHFSTRVDLHMAVGLLHFKPELIFVEIASELQPCLDRNRGKYSTPAFALLNTAALEVNARPLAVDEPVAVKLAPLTLEKFHARTSPETHGRIAGRIVQYLAEFHEKHDRLPRFAVVFGKDHFNCRNDLDEMVEQGIAALHLPKFQSCSIEVDNEEPKLTHAKLRRNWFADFDYTLQVSPSLLKGLPDLRNPDFSFKTSQSSSR
jgi:hypothetical protein